MPILGTNTQGLGYKETEQKKSTSSQNTKKGCKIFLTGSNFFLYRRSSRKLTSGAGQSDNESEASGVSWASGLASNRKRAESGSESERSVRRTHRSRRKR